MRLHLEEKLKKREPSRLGEDQYWRPQVTDEDRFSFIVDSDK